jgi:ribosomal protein S3
MSRACYGVLRFVMENEAKGVEVVVSGKLRSQRAKAMKFCDGFVLLSYRFSYLQLHEEVRLRHHRVR